MASRVVTQLIDDLDGSSIDQGTGETVTFGLDGSTYQIDLSDKNAADLRESLAQYVGAARRTGGGQANGTRRRRRSKNKPDDMRDYDPKEVRQWAEQHAVDVPSRGRIPQAVLTQFLEAN